MFNERTNVTVNMLENTCDCKHVGKYVRYDLRGCTGHVDSVKSFICPTNVHKLL